MKISEVYEKYKIAPWLAEHMFRVTAVAVTIFEALGEKEGREDLICAGLFHDLGNVLKFHFDKLQLANDEDVEKWETVKKEFIEKYGSSAHHATIKILEEMGVKKSIIDTIDGMSFTKSVEIAEGDNILLKILTYADMRVVPTGIGSLDERISDMYKRYTDKHPKDSEKTKRGVEGMHILEKQLFSGLSIKPTEITEESVADNISLLRDFDISQALQ